MTLAGLRWKVLLGTVLIVGTGLTGVALVDTRPEPVRARDWAKANSHRLPSIIDMASYPAAFRRAAFEAMSPAEKSEAASEFFTHFLARPLNAEQRQFIQEMRSLLTPAVYEAVYEPGHKERLKWVCDRVGLLFPDEEERHFLATFGAGRRDADPWRNRVAAIQRAVGIGVAYADATEAVEICDCTEFTFCSGCSGLGGVCTDSPASFPDPGFTCRMPLPWEEPLLACGCFMAFPCTGMCDRSPENLRPSGGR
jgi:hypothetical protein